LNILTKKNLSPAIVTQNELHHKVSTEQINLLFSNLFISIPSSLLCASIIFTALYRIPHTTMLIYWFIGTIAVSVLRLLHASFAIHKKKYTKFQFIIFIFMTTIAALIWGYVGSMLMPNNYPIEQMIVVIVIAGIISGGTQSLQASMLACLIYANLILIPLLAWVFLQDTIPYIILGISMILYLLFTISISIKGYLFLKQTLIMKYENIDLTENISISNQRLQQTNQDLIEKENNLRLIHDNAPIGMAIVSLDGKWLNVNNKLCELLGFSKEELEDLTIQDITYEEDLEIDLDDRTKLLSGKLQSYRIEKRFVTKNNSLNWIVTNVSIVRGKGDKPLYYISQIQDINDEKQNEIIMSELSHMNEMLQLCHNSREAYPIISHAAQKIFNDLNGGLSIFNTDYHEQEVTSRWGNVSLLKPFFKSEDCWAFRSGNIYIANDMTKDSACKHFDTSSLGGYTCLPLIIQGKVLGMLNFTANPGQTISFHQQQIINNFSEIVKLSLANIHLNEALKDQAIHDPLTGLLNRRYLYESLPQTLNHALRMKQSFTVCMIDIDFFKKINDTYGHDAGDEVLKFIAALLKNNLRKSDMICRFGGEEFVVVLLDNDLEHAKSQMELIRLAVKDAQIKIQKQTLPSISISIGIAETPKHGVTISDLLRAADSALYIAKKTGRDRIVQAEIAQNLD